MHLEDTYIQDDLYCIQADAFLGYQTHDLGAANTMIYCLSYSNTHLDQITDSDSEYWFIEEMQLKRIICSWTGLWLEESQIGLFLTQSYCMTKKSWNIQ